MADLTQIAILIIVVILIIVLLKVLVGLAFVLPEANYMGLGKALALTMTSHSGQSGLTAYNIMMNVKINGHPLTMELDTGMDFTLIPPSFSTQLGLDQLPSVGYCSLQGISGQAQQCDVKEVTMQIENSHPFYTKVLIAPQNGMPPLLSVFSLYQAYRLEFVPIK